MKQITNSHSDIIIVGNGITSQFLALKLLDTLGDRIKLTIIDKKTKSSLNSKHARSLSISLSTVNLCKSLGIWELVEPYAHPIDKIIISRSEFGGETESTLNLHNRVNDEIASYIVDESKLRGIISKEISNFSNIDILHANLNKINLANNQVIINLDGQILTTKLLVAGDGRKSIVKDLLDIQSVSWDYNQIALSCLIKHKSSNDNVAVENFLNTGPVALLPIGKNKSSVIWSIKRDKSDYIKSITNDELKQRMEGQFGDYVGQIIDIENFSFFELNFSIVRNLYSERLAIIGDAAHSIHPLAGQGTNLGLRDVICLADKIIEAIKYGLDIGSINILDEYQRKRMPDILTSALAYDAINRLYSNDIKKLNILKDFAINFTENTPILKKNLVKGGSGVSLLN